MIGQTLGHYRIESKLGQGGMGVVYRAHDKNLDRDIALKLLPFDALVDEAARVRFRQEALALSQLNHPHICTIYEVGQADGQSYIAMELVEGRPLTSLLRADGLAVETVIRYGAQIADALAHAHHRDVIHRDLKSSNVMVTPEGRAKLLDFGLAKRLREAESDEATRSLTETGSVVGTLAYIAPEVLRGEPADARSDIWALGVLLYEAVTGGLPFRGQTGFEVSSAILKESAAPLPARISVGLRSIIQRCLAKDPAERYQRASEVRAALEAVQHDSAAALDVPPRGTTVRWLFPLAGGAMLVLGLLAVLAGRAWHGLDRGVPGRIEALAVLPLANLSGDPAQDYFADGMTEALITDLAKIGALKVSSRTSVMKYKGTRQPSPPLPEIARELGVDAVVEGSVVRSGDRVRVTAQLIHARTDKHLWAQNYERGVRDVLALQSEVARAIADEIRVKLTPQQEARLGKAKPVHPEAYDLYLRAKFHANRGENKAENESVIAMLERAVAIDPEFASAHAELAYACVLRLFIFTPQEKQWEEKAFVAIEKALSRDPDLPEAHVARGRLLWTPVNRFPHEKAIEEYRRALAVNPNLDEAHHQLALVYIHIGLLEKAQHEAETAVALNPSNIAARYRIGESLLFQGKYNEALAVFERTTSGYNPGVRGYQTAWALFQLGRRQEAAAMLEEFLSDYPEDTGGVFAGMQAIFSAAVGDARRAEEKVRQAAAKRAFGHFHHTAYSLASAYALLNKPQAAVQWLQEAVDTGFACYPVFERDPNLDHIRGNLQFIALMTRLKQEWEHRTAAL